MESIKEGVECDRLEKFVPDSRTREANVLFLQHSVLNGTTESNISARPLINLLVIDTLCLASENGTARQAMSAPFPEIETRRGKRNIPRELKLRYASGDKIESDNESDLVATDRHQNIEKNKDDKEQKTQT
uniref:Uncharacterized protein n=1 Tax=Setaria digitata TaxID=48799 RepID=A0A915Q0J5_9BILA